MLSWQHYFSWPRHPNNLFGNAVCFWFSSGCNVQVMINSAKRKESQTQATAQPNSSRKGTVTVHDNKVPRITIII